MSFHCGRCGRSTEQDGTHLDPAGEPTAPCKQGAAMVVADAAPTPPAKSPPDDGERIWGLGGLPSGF